MSKQPELPRLIDSRHPVYLSNMTDWEKWRLTYNGGDAFRDRYLKKFDTRETAGDFADRKAMTPIPTFAKAAINDIRNAIFQRLGDVVRSGGSDSYQKAVQGEFGGVDHRGATMNFFLGNRLLTELLIMGKVGVFVDMPESAGMTLAEAVGKRPYLYFYQVEDILNYSQSKPDEPSTFQSVLLQDTVLEYDRNFFMPSQAVKRYRHLWIDDLTGRVNVQFYSPTGDLIDSYGHPSGPIELELTQIPFVLLDIGDSLIKDVASYQIALLNLGSSDVNYALKANFPFYTEQHDMRGGGAHLKKVASDGTATTGGQGAADETIRVGVTQGRYYDRETDRPGFIAPPSEPLEASMKLQDKLEQDIRKLVNLAVVNLAPRASAESKAMDNQGLEAGLSFIGLALESAERQVATYWAGYEERVEARRQIATIKYPDRYSLKSDGERVEESEKLSKLMTAVPGRTVKRELAKTIVTVLLGGKVKVDTLQAIYREIDDASYTTSDPKTIIEAKEAGLVGEQTASIALGFPDDEYKQAREDHVARIKRIAEAQGQNELNGDPASRGVADLSGEPSKAASEEKEASRNTDLSDSTRSRVRGDGRT